MYRNTFAWGTQNFSYMYSVCMGAILHGVRKITPVYIGTLLRRGTQNFSYMYNVCMGAILHGVRKITPVYIGTLLRRGTQNYSYIYRNNFV